MTLSFQYRRNRRDRHLLQRERGAALLMVIATIAILTAVAVDLAYNTRVSLHTAANARDELRAYYLAKSAVNLSRLVIHFQHQLDQTTAGLGNLGSMLGAAGIDLGALGGKGGLPPGLAAGIPGLGGAAGAGGIPGLPGMGSGSLNLRLWEIVPIDSNVAQMFLASSGEKDPNAPPPPPPPAPGTPGAAPERKTADTDFLETELGQTRGFGGFEGSFHAKVADEERKTNVTQLAGIGGLPIAQLARLRHTIQDPKWDFLFQDEDANGVRVSRDELIVALRDWADEDETASSLTTDPRIPFAQGFSDENYTYDHYPDRYKAKNARFDSHDELYLIAGATDAFMAAFGDSLTVYPDINAPINVNTNDPVQVLININVMAEPVPQAILLDPTLVPRVMEAMQLAKLFSFMSISVQQFAQILQSLGVQVQAPYIGTNSDNRSAFSDRSSTFHIHAVGAAGDVQKDIDCVITVDRRAGALADDLGRIIYWHEG